MGHYLLAGTDVPLLELASEIALTHHERWDGDGYPIGLAGEDIPLAGRIVSVADTFDALTSVRTYKRAWSREAARSEIEASGGARFDEGGGSLPRRPAARGDGRLSRPSSPGGQNSPAAAGPS